MTSCLLQRYERAGFFLADQDVSHASTMFNVTVFFTFTAIIIVLCTSSNKTFYILSFCGVVVTDRNEKKENSNRYECRILKHREPKRLLREGVLRSSRHKFKTASKASSLYTNTSTLAPQVWSSPKFLKFH